MIIELKKKYQCQSIIEELDELIKDSVSLFDDFSNCRVSGKNVQKIERFETILLDHLLEKTNFENVFDSLKISYGDIKQGFHTIIYNLFCQIGKNNKTPNFNQFLLELDKKVRQLRKKKENKFTYYIPSRVEINQLNNNEKNNLRKKVKKSTGMTFKKLTKSIIKNIKSNNMKSLFSNRELIFRLEIKARDYVYPSKILDRKVSTFLGAIAFSNHLFKDTRKLISSSNDMSISSKEPLDDYLIIVENNKSIVYPHKNRWQILDYEIKKDVTMVGKNIWNVHNRYDGNYKRLITILDLLSKQDKKIKEISEDSLKLYLEAITEKQLELSFLKFWIITERIIKQGGKRKDDSLILILKKIIKEKHLKRMIDSLYRKRNDMVHEFKINYISQQDRNLAKAIAEQTILFLIDPPTKIKNLEEFKILIDNVFSSKENLKAKRKIINKLIKNKK